MSLVAQRSAKPLGSKWGVSIKKNKDGVDFLYFRKCHHFENILFELGAVD
jgi:hypothetical protein